MTSLVCRHNALPNNGEISTWAKYRLVIPCGSLCFHTCNLVVCSRVSQTIYFCAWTHNSLIIHEKDNKNDKTLNIFRSTGPLVLQIGMNTS